MYHLFRTSFGHEPRPTNKCSNGQYFYTFRKVFTWFGRVVLYNSLYCANEKKKKIMMNLPLLRRVFYRISLILLKVIKKLSS